MNVFFCGSQAYSQPSHATHCLVPHTIARGMVFVACPQINNTIVATIVCMLQWPQHVILRGTLFLGGLYNNYTNIVHSQLLMHICIPSYFVALQYSVKEMRVSSAKKMSALVRELMSPAMQPQYTVITMPSKTAKS